MTLPRSAFLLWLAFILPLSAWAEERVLLDDGAGFSIESRVLAFDGEFYTVETEAGPLTLTARGLSCTGQACPKPPNLSYDLSVGDAALQRLAVSVLRDYTRQNGHGLDEIFALSGIEVLTLKDHETGAQTRFNFVPSGGDFQLRRGPGATPRAIALAFDALVPAVASENAVTGLTLLALRAAYAGEFPDWSGLGGDPHPVTVYWPRGFQSPLADRFGLRPGSNVAFQDQTRSAAAALMEDPGGLALLPLSEIGGAVPLVVTGACGRGMLAVADAIRSSDYPLSEVVSLSPPQGRLSPLLRDFMTWLKTPEAWGAVRRAGFVDLRVAPVANGRDGRQESDPVALSLGGTFAVRPETSSLDGATRLNVAMRFQDGSSQPDRLARMQISRLVEAIQSGQFEGQSLIFVGFSDADGAATTNIRLSERRAETIRNEVLAALAGAGGVTEFRALGIGEAIPVACNGVAWGERLNRRVEVWAAAP